MPNQDDLQPVAVKEDDGFVRIKLDAPVGSVLSQPLSNSPDPAPPSTQSPSDTSKDSNEQSTPSTTASSEAESMSQKVQEAVKKEQEAKQATQQALESVKKAEEESISAQIKLKQQVEHSQQQIQEAQQQIQEAQEAQKETQEKIKEAEKSSGLSVGGYRPMDLAQALVKPPEPSNTSDGPTIDSSSREKIKTENQQVEKQVKQTQKQVKEADKYVSTAIKQATDTEKRQNSIISKITKTIDKLVPDHKASDTGMPEKTQPSRVFIILGGIVLLLAFLTLIVAKSSIWILIAIVALIQIGMGTVLKKHQQ